MDTLINKKVLDAINKKVLDAYMQAAESQLVSDNTLKALMEPDETRRKIDAAKNPVEVAQIVREEITSTGIIDTVQWEEYAPGYARKRARSKSREEQLEEKEEFEGLGEPFTPPISTEDVTGL